MVSDSVYRCFECIEPQFESCLLWYELWTYIHGYIRVVAVGNSTIKIPLMPNSRTLTDDVFKRLVASLIENQATQINDQRFNLSFSVVKHITQKEHCCCGRGGGCRCVYEYCYVRCSTSNYAATGSEFDKVGTSISFKICYKVWKLFFSKMRFWKSIDFFQHGTD